jgi:hypothetical protein
MYPMGGRKEGRFKLRVTDGIEAADRGKAKHAKRAWLEAIRGRYRKRTAPAKPGCSTVSGPPERLLVALP